MLTTLCVRYQDVLPKAQQDTLYETSPFVIDEGPEPSDADVSQTAMPHQLSNPRANAEDPLLGGSIAEVPSHIAISGSRDMLRQFITHFWQWRSLLPYYIFVGSFTFSLLALTVILRNVSLYFKILGFLALGLEATLPLPQLFTFVCLAARYRNH